VGSDLPCIGDNLGKDRPHPLALRAGAGGDINFARTIDPHGRTFEGADPGSLDIKANAEPKISALSARLLLALTERRDPADSIERFLQRARVIAAVVNDLFAVPIEDARTIGHLLGTDHVAPAH